MVERKENTKKIGAWGETLACDYLIRQGYEIVSRNVFTEYGEIDIVARRADRIHMVEVKTRRTDAFGRPEEAVTPKKLRHMIDSAAAYLQQNPDLGQNYQIDVIAIQVQPDGKDSEITLFENVI